MLAHRQLVFSVGAHMKYWTGFVEQHCIKVKWLYELRNLKQYGFLNQFNMP